MDKAIKIFKYKIQGILDNLPKNQYGKAIQELQEVLRIGKTQFYNIRTTPLNSNSSANTDQIQKIAQYFHEKGIYPNCTVNDLLNDNSRSILSKTNGCGSNDLQESSCLSNKAKASCEE